MPKPRFLSVVVNKYLSLDSEGRPNALVCRVDTVRSEPIGAVLVPVTEEAEKNHDELQYVYDDQPVTLADHPTHRKALQSGQLFPADEATARMVGLPFVPVAERLEQARLVAIERYAAETGEESEHLRAPLPPPKAPPSDLPPALALPAPTLTTKASTKAASKET